MKVAVGLSGGVDSSVAALLLTTSCLLTDIPKEEPAGPDPNAMGGMGGGMPGMGGMGF